MRKPIDLGIEQPVKVEINDASSEPAKPDAAKPDEPAKPSEPAK